MKQGKVIKAMKALNKLYDQELPLPISYKVFKMKKQLQSAWEFQLEQEREIFAMYPPEKAENGGFKFATPEDAQGFKERMEELSNMECEIEVKPTTIVMRDDILLSGDDFAALQDFIFFVDPEDEFPAQ